LTHAHSRSSVAVDDFSGGKGIPNSPKHLLPIDDANRLRVFFLPFFARGHLIPLTDLACRLAAEVEATVVVTPANAALIEPTAVRVLRYPFPDVGLGEGAECLGAAAARDEWKVYRAVELSQPTHEALLREHRPDAVVADVPFWWTTDVAAELGVPRLTSHPVGVFPQLAMSRLVPVRAGGGPVSVPGMPGKEIAIPVSELPDFLVKGDHLTVLWDRLKASQLAGFGVVVNTFADLEEPYCEQYRRVDARRAYFVGPIRQPSLSAVRRGRGLPGLAVRQAEPVRGVRLLRELGQVLGDPDDGAGHGPGGVEPTVPLGGPLRRQL
jgi:hypothetical protein